jgi:predicted O-linked N-acetylglucosamine transferase (SPINDLY family)
MGADFIDYAIVDRTVVPEEQQPCFSEKLIYLPDCFQVSDSKRPTPAAAPQRARLGLPDHVLVFCCFNNSYKITAAFFDAWMRLLAAVPGSVLWLVADNRWVEANLKDEARRAGIDPARLIFAPQLDDPSELSHRRAADLFLDTSPYNGGATCNDALWCGLPVIACCGHGFASRMTASLLKAIGMPELVAHSLAQYEDLALTLARSPARLASLKDQLLRNKTRTTLFDTQRFCRNLEAAFGEVRRVSEAGEQPSSFSIELAH